MGRHGAPQRRRGVAGWLVAAVAGVVVVAIAIVVFVLVVGRDTSSTSGCSATVQLSVTSADDLSAAVTAAAAAFDATHPVIRSACVTTKVIGQPDSRTATALMSSSGGGDAPALWVADSTAAIDAIARTDGALVAGRSTSAIASSPVVLAVRTSDAEAVRAAGDALTWSSLPALGTAISPPSGPWSLALPSPADNLPVNYALQSVVAGQAASSVPVTAADVGTAAAALAQLGGNAAKNPPSSVADALTALASGKADFTAVPAFESQVAAAGADGHIAALYPAGSDVAAPVYVVPITASWVNETEQAAAAAFSAYLDDQPGRQSLADHGLRVAGTTPAKALPGVDLTAKVTTLAPTAGLESGLAAALTTAASPGSSPASTSAAPAVSPTTSSPTTSPPATSSPAASATGTTLASAATSGTATRSSDPTGSSTKAATKSAGSDPSGPTGPVVTFLIDASATMSQQVNGKSRLDWVKTALGNYLRRLPNSDAGLYEVSTSVGPAGYHQAVTTGPLAGRTGTSTRAATLSSALAGFTAAGKCNSYGALQTAYARAAQNPLPSRKNFVVLITASSDAAPSLPRDQLVSSLSDSASNAATTVELDVVGLAANVDADAMTQIARAGRGSFTAVAADQLDGWLNDAKRFG